MKKLVNVTEVEGEGLTALLGERVTLFCMNYIYTGKLLGVNENDVMLEDPGIVYETGKFDDKSWKDHQKLGVKFWYIKISSIESYGVLK
jgi:hypothetical protein